MLSCFQAILMLSVYLEARVQSQNPIVATVRLTGTGCNHLFFFKLICAYQVKHQMVGNKII